MALSILALSVVSFVIAWLTTAAMIRLAPKFGFVDKPGGRKIHANPKPLGGGVALFLGVALPLAAGLLAASFGHPPGGLTERQLAYWEGARQQAPLAAGMLATMVVMHLMGLRDDHKALGPYSKLFIQLGATAALIVAMEIFARHTPSLRLRVLTALDGWLGLGPWPSIVVTVLWIGGITNAFNFLDNMDGLSAGVAAVCTTAFLITTMLIGQWFVAATLAMLLGSLLGFLCWNFPPARIFMGDSGSLLIGLLLGVLTVRTTFLLPDENFAAGWYAVLAPVLVLALPLYDLVVVSAIRISRGKSPFVGDTNHFSHRLVQRGMSRRTAVLCLYLVSAATAIGAVLLPHVHSGFAAGLIVAQTALILGVVMLLEQHPLPPERRESDATEPTSKPPQS